MKNLRQFGGAVVLTCALSLPAFAGQMPTVSSAKGQMPTPTVKPASVVEINPIPATNNQTASFALWAEAALDLLQGALYLF
jgi:hypothetical protein